MTESATAIAPAAGKMTASEFLSYLFPATPGYLALWRGDTKTTVWIHAGDWAKADAYVERAKAVPFNAYFGCALQARDCGPDSRGKAESTVAVPGVWIDLDYQEKIHHGAQPRKKNYPPRAIVEKCLDALPIPASLRIFTGGGIHAYWALKSPFIIQTDSDRQRIAEVVKSWQGGIKSWLLKAGGFGVDSTFDLARVMRLPGTPHLSHPGLIVDIDPASPGTRARYSLEEIERHLPKGSLPATPARPPAPQPKPASPAKPAATLPTDGARRDCSPAPPSPAPSPADPPAIYASETSEPPAGKLYNLCEASPEFKRVWNEKYKPTGDPNDESAFDMTLANYAINAKWSPQEAAGLIVAFNRKHWPDHLEKVLRVTGGVQDYLKLTIEKADKKRITSGNDATSPPSGPLPLTLEKVGRRHYIVGKHSFDYKDQIKEFGGHWDETRKQWWVGEQKRAAAEAFIAGEAPPASEPAAKPATPPSPMLIEARKHVAGLPSIDDPASEADSEDLFVGRYKRNDPSADETALRTCHSTAWAERRKAETDPQIRISAALEIARQGLGRDDLIEVLKIGRENPEFALVFQVAGKELQVELGQGDAVFNHKRIKIQLLISPLCHSIPDWKPKAWEGFATAIIQAARLVETSDSLKEVASIIKRAQATNEESQEIEPAKFDEIILRESAGKGKFYSPVYGKKGEPAVYVSLDRIADWAWTELRCTIERKEFSRRLAKLGFTPIQIQGRAIAS